MIQSLYTAATAMASQQFNIDTIANNISNINTNGYKSNRADFADALYAQMDRTIQSQANQLRGHGMLIGAVQRINSAGVAIYSGSLMDMMISGDGYFTVEDAKGNRFFTRNGAFSMSTENGNNYLTTGDGSYVLDSNNRRIGLNGTTEIAVDDVGNIMQNGASVARLGIVSFANPSGLQNVGGDRYTATAASGAVAAASGTVMQGYQEGSNVDLTEEMTRLIRAQKAYSILSKAISTADQMASVANGIGS